MYTRSLNSRGRDSRREKLGSEEDCAEEGVIVMCEAGRARTGVTGGASCIAVSDESPLEVEEREGERGVDMTDAMFGVERVTLPPRVVLSEGVRDDD